MPFQTFDRNSLAFFATLAATLTLFASSLFYNRIEAPLAILILIAAILLRGQLFTQFDKVKILLIVHTIYAISLLSNGISFGSREYTSFDVGISSTAIGFREKSAMIPMPFRLNFQNTFHTIEPNRVYIS